MDPKKESRYILLRVVEEWGKYADDTSFNVRHERSMRGWIVTVIFPNFDGKYVTVQRVIPWHHWPTVVDGSPFRSAWAAVEYHVDRMRGDCEHVGITP